MLGRTGAAQLGGPAGQQFDIFWLVGADSVVLSHLEVHLVHHVILRHGRLCMPYCEL